MSNWSTTPPLVPGKLGCCTVGGATCQYKDGSPECHAVMKEICKMPAHGDKQYCKDWAIKYPAIALPSVREYCIAGNRFDNPWCACILSKATGIGGQVNPFCIDQKCASTAAFHPDYMTRGCPDVIDCTQIVNMKNIGISVAPSIESKSNCGKGGSADQPASGSSGWTLIIVVLFVVLAVITATVVVVIRRFSVGQKN